MEVHEFLKATQRSLHFEASTRKEGNPKAYRMLVGRGKTSHKQQYDEPAILFYGIQLCTVPTHAATPEQKRMCEPPEARINALETSMQFV